MCYTLSEVYRLPVRTYTAIAPNASYRVTTKFAQSELDSSKQKAGYHRHGDTLPLLVYRSAYSRRRPPVNKNVPKPFFVKNRVRMTLVDIPMGLGTAG